MKTRFKKGCMKTAAIFVTIVMLFSIVKLPAAYAYFTAEGESEILTFIIKTNNNTNANVTFIDNFLIDEDENEDNRRTGEEGLRIASGISAMNPPSTRSLSASTFSAGSMEALFGEGMESIEKKLTAANRVQVEIRLEDGFDVAETYLPSIELHYGENSAPALSGELDGDDVLLVDFDRDLIAGWFEGTGEEMEDVTFTVTGEGYSDGLDLFTFSGDASILLKGSYETRAVAITGSDAFFIPEPGETIEEPCLLVNQDGTVLEGARWALDNADTVKGVEIDCETGLLTIYSNAAQGPVTIMSVIELEGRILMAQKPVQLYKKPELVISGADTITVPLPQENTQEQYGVKPLTDETLADKTLTDISWKLLEEVDGVSVDEKGLVTVTDEVVAEDFTLLALIEVQIKGINIPLTLEKPVQLETIVIGSVEVTGTESIIIPDGEPFQEYYEALLYDPEGNELEGEPVTWSLENGTSGVSIEREEGLLIVENSAASTLITVVATSVRNTEVRGSKTVTLIAYPAELVERSPSPVEKELLVIEGSTLILIPSPNDDGTSQQNNAYYSAKILDQEGNLLKDAEVSWSLAEAVEGVLLSAEGELTVTSAASEGIVTIIATSVSNGEVAGSFEVQLVNGTEPLEGSGGENGGGETGDDENPPGKEEDPPELEEPPEGGDSGDDGSADGGGIDNGDEDNGDGDDDDSVGNNGGDDNEFADEGDINVNEESFDNVGVTVNLNEVVDSDDEQDTAVDDSAGGTQEEKKDD